MGDCRAPHCLPRYMLRRAFEHVIGKVSLLKRLSCGTREVIADWAPARARTAAATLAPRPVSTTFPTTTPISASTPIRAPAPTPAPAPPTTTITASHCLRPGNLLKRISYCYVIYTEINAPFSRQNCAPHAQLCRVPAKAFSAQAQRKEVVPILTSHPSKFHATND